MEGGNYAALFAHLRENEHIMSKVDEVVYVCGGDQPYQSTSYEEMRIYCRGRRLTFKGEKPDVWKKQSVDLAKIPALEPARHG